MNAKKLIEETLPLPQINTASDTDKRTHDGHISTMHTWWARRPLPMARAVAAASLIDSGEDAAQVEEKIAQAMTTKALTNNRAISWLRNRIRDSGAGQPKVLDCFAGGGAIPLEALRLGCDTTAMDLNPVAHLIELACLDYPQRYRDYNELGRNSLAVDVARWADWVSDSTRKVVDDLYPRAEGQSDPAPYYFWVRTMPSPDPNVAAEIPILSSRLLAAARRSAWVTTTASSEGVDIDVHQGTLPDDPSLKEGFESAGSVTCPISGITAPQRDVKQHGRDHGFGYRLYAVCDVDGRSRTYRRPTSVELEGPMRATSKAEALDVDEFDDGTPRLPDEAVDEIGYNNLQFLPYGYRTWRSLFTDRQLVLFATLAGVDPQGAHRDGQRGHGPRTGHGGGHVPGVRARQGRRPQLRLLQLGDQQGNDPGHVSRARRCRCAGTSARTTRSAPARDPGTTRCPAICKVIEHCAQAGEGPATVLRGDAQALPFADGEFDAVLIDPPYYFSVMYSDLSDFFYVWLKRSVGHLYPEHFVTPWTPKAQEIVQNRCRPGLRGHITEEDFDRRLGNALSEVARVVKPDGVVAIVFAHTDVKAWEKLLLALRVAGLGVTTSWPIRSEMAGRPVAHVKAALRSSVVLVCRPLQEADDAFYGRGRGRAQPSGARAARLVRGHGPARRRLFRVGGRTCFRGVRAPSQRDPPRRVGGIRRRPHGIGPQDGRPACHGATVEHRSPQDARRPIAAVRELALGIPHRPHTRRRGDQAVAGVLCQPRRRAARGRDDPPRRQEVLPARAAPAARSADPPRQPDHRLSPSRRPALGLRTIIGRRRPF